ncbi:MAG: serine/threonine-protein kinase [Kofleriaceae bacterium]
MPDLDDDLIALEATQAAILRSTKPTHSPESTVVPADVEDWNLRGPQQLPSIRLRFPSGAASSAIDEDIDLLDVLGEGGMGRVYRATQRSLDREVAVKLLRDTAASSEAAAALCDEAVVTGRLSHPNIVPVHMLGDAGGGRPVLVMKRVEGVAWNTLLHRPDHGFWGRAKIAVDDRPFFHLEVLRKVTHAIAFAHSRGVLHRDIKPENVMLGEFGEVYLVDWGIAVKSGSTVRRAFAGTPAYVAPEMLDGVADERSDVYLLGATLHEILVGVPPHRGASLPDVLRSAHRGVPPTLPPHIPPELAELCRRALSRHPDDRPQSAHAFGEALDDHVRHRGSRLLARKGQERLALLQAAADLAPEARDLATVRRLVAESRFAFLEARSAWAENPAVKEGLVQCVTLAVRVELDRRDAEAARAMIGDLEVPDPGLEREIAALEAQLAAERRELDRLARLAQDHDPDVEASVRTIVAAFLVVAVAGLTVYIAMIDRVTIATSLILVVGMLVLVGAAAIALRRRIERSGFARKVVAFVAITIGAMVAHRTVSVFEPAATITTVLRTDLILLGAAWALGSIFLFRWMLFVAIVLVLWTIPTFIVPSYTPFLFTGANIATITTFLFSVRRSPRTKGDEPTS